MVQRHREERCAGASRNHEVIQAEVIRTCRHASTRNKGTDRGAIAGVVLFPTRRIDLVPGRGGHGLVLYRFDGRGRAVRHHEAGRCVVLEHRLGENRAAHTDEENKHQHAKSITLRTHNDVLLPWTQLHLLKAELSLASADFPINLPLATCDKKA